VKVIHSYREANQCDDALANLGCSLNNLVMFYESCPTHVRNLFVADAMGITTPRLIFVYLLLLWRLLIFAHALLDIDWSRVFLKYQV